jgi:hypothetical protein
MKFIIAVLALSATVSAFANDNCLPIFTNISGQKYTFVYSRVYCSYSDIQDEMIDAVAKGAKTVNLDVTEKTATVTATYFSDDDKIYNNYVLNKK